MMPIPAELRSLPHWVGWRHQRRDGRMTKIPYVLGENGRKARANDPTTWRGFDAAEAFGPQYDGIGFELLKGGGFSAVDLDLCRDKQTGKIAPWAREIVRRFDSYTEITPSQEGLRIFCKGTLAEGEGWRNKRLGEARPDGHTAGCEVYSDGKYLTVTGQHLDGTPETVNDAQAALDWLQENPPTLRDRPGLTAHTVTEGRLTDEELIKKASAASNGDKFARLWAGDTSMHGGDDSAADLALCSHLAYWTDGDATRSDRLFRRSGLYRPKWDERRNAAGESYGEITLRKALDRFTPIRHEPKPAALAVPKERGRLITADELDLLDLPPPQFVVEGLLPKGLMILGGKPKAGKSFALLNLLLAVAAGGKAFGIKDVDAGECLYLALEDTQRRLQDRQRMMLGGAKPPRALTYATEWRNLAEGGLDDLEEWLSERPRKMFAVDTLVTVRELRRRNGDLYTEDYLAVNALTKLAHKYECCGVLVHHLRKAEGEDPVDLLSGTLGLAGAADGVMVLKRIGKKSATLSIVHRDMDRLEYALEWDASVGSWTITGDADDVRLSEERKSVLDVLDESQRRMGPSEIAQVLAKPVGPMRRLLWQMVRDGQVLTYPDHTYSPSKVTGNGNDASNGGNAVTGEGSTLTTAIVKSALPLPRYQENSGVVRDIETKQSEWTDEPVSIRNDDSAQRDNLDKPETQETYTSPLSRSGVVHLRCTQCGAWLMGTEQAGGVCRKCREADEEAF